MTVQNALDFDTYRESVGPEHRLIWCVFERAVLDAFGPIKAPTGSKRYIRAKARAWLMDWEGTDPFSCPWICSVLNIPKEQVMRVVRNGTAERKRHNNNTGDTLFQVLDDPDFI